MSNIAIQFHDEQPDVASFRDEVLRGLASDPRAIPPKFFYDERGSQLFDNICEQPEYYPTRSEMEILRTHAPEIADLTGRGALLVELGSGATRKVRLLLDALQPAAYMGVDISRDFLVHSARKLAEDYPWLDVRATCMDFSRHIHLANCPTGHRRLAFFPGSSIGNFEPEEARHFLRRLHGALGRNGALLIGVDLKKDPALLNAAYNDAAGVTAAFNRNLLQRMRNELGAELDVDGFGHRAFYDEGAGRVEMHLVARTPQQIGVGSRWFGFQAGDTIHTENSYKYSTEEFRVLAAEAGFRSRAVWTGANQLFSVHFLDTER